MDATQVIEAMLAGLLGGGVYVFYNHLVQQKLYLQALWHLAAGAVVGLLAIFMLGYVAPVTIADAMPIVILGYAGTDVIDSLAQRIASTPPAPPTPAPPA
jgi:hypothetical protein